MDVERDAFEPLDRAALIELVLMQQARITALEAQVTQLRAELAARAGAPPSAAGSSPPSWVRPSRPALPAKTTRRKRPHNFARRRDTSTEIVEHVVAVCPACGTALQGGEVVRRRQVLHLPRVPVQIIEHVVRRRVCPRCGQVATPALDLSSAVVGHHRVSAATMASIASLHTVGRLPIRTIQWLVETMHGLHLSVGGLVEIVQAVAARAQPALAGLQAAVRASPVVHADETGWRQAGVNGYVWTFSTPTLRYFHHDRRRAGAVVQQVLGPVYEGTLVSDFYSAYSIHEGPHQRCWVHLLRDLHDLGQLHPDDAALQTWAQAVWALYRDATVTAAAEHAWPQRVAERARLDTALLALCQPGLAPGSPLLQATLCHRIDRFLDELFAFVLDPTIPPDNNLAERSLRPLVIARKISGGTRSAQGSQVRMALASLFGTWLAQGRDPLDACHQMLLTQAL